MAPDPCAGEMGHRLPDHREVALEVDPHRQVPLLLGDTPEVGIAGRGRVVHDDVEAPERVERVLHDASRAVPGRRGRVGGRVSSRGDDLVDHTGGVGAGAQPHVVDEHRRPFGGEELGVLPPDAAARARHDRNLPVQPSAHGPRGYGCLTDRTTRGSRRSRRTPDRHRPSGAGHQRTRPPPARGRRPGRDRAHPRWRSRHGADRRAPGTELLLAPPVPDLVEQLQIVCRSALAGAAVGR